MGTASVIVFIDAAEKNYGCDWCGEKINAHEPYCSYVYYGANGNGSTVNLHPECAEALEEWGQNGGEEFDIGDNPRGCDCGFDYDCANCASRKG